MVTCFLCFVDRAALYNIVNKANLVHNFSYYVYFMYMIMSRVNNAGRSRGMKIDNIAI
jgi:hypothetical protein